MAWCKNSAINPTYQKCYCWMSSIHLFIFFSICLILWFVAVEKAIERSLKQSTRENRNPSKFWNPSSCSVYRLASNTLLTEIVNLTNNVPLLHTMHWAQNKHIVCDAYICKIFNRTHTNSLMNSIVLRQNASRNKINFHNFSPCSTTYLFISFT